MTKSDNSNCNFCELGIPVLGGILRGKTVNTCKHCGRKLGDTN